MRSLIIVISSILLCACMSKPEGVTPVQDFELNKYLGKWYEIARLDHSFERGMTNVTAEYQMRDDGGVSVLNRGYLTETKEWKEAEGKAYFVNKTDEGSLKVSFFGPFYGSYIVFDLGKTGNSDDYQYSFVSGPNLSYLWLLSRTPTVDDDVMQSFIQQADKVGFNIKDLIVVEH